MQHKILGARAHRKHSCMLSHRGPTARTAAHLLCQPPTANRRGDVYLYTHTGYLWSDADAAVYCRQLGYGGGGLAYTGAVYGAATSSYMLTAVACGGGEAAIGACTAQPLVYTGAWSPQVCGLWIGRKAALVPGLMA